MASRDPVAPSEDAWRKLRRQYWEQQRQLRNLQNRLTAITKGRNVHDRFAPPRIRFKNTASEEVPAWGLMRITTPAESGADYLTTAKPDATYRWVYLVNGPKDVPASRYGYGHFLTSEAFILRRQYVLYDTGATPAYGERWGPKNDSWLIWQHRPGFWIMGSTEGANDTARVLAIQIPPGEVRVKNDTGSAVAAGSTGTFGVYGGSAGTTDTGLEVSLTNGSSTSWANTKYGFATADAGGLIFGAPHQT